MKRPLGFIYTENWEEEGTRRASRSTYCDLVACKFEQSKQFKGIQAQLIDERGTTYTRNSKSSTQKTKKKKEAKYENTWKQNKYVTLEKVILWDHWLNFSY